MRTGPPKLVQNQPGKRKFYIGVSVRENYFARDFITNVALGTDIANKKIGLLMARAQSGRYFTAHGWKMVKSPIDSRPA